MATQIRVACEFDIRAHVEQLPPEALIEAAAFYDEVRGSAWRRIENTIGDRMARLRVMSKTLQFPETARIKPQNFEATVVEALRFARVVHTVRTRGLQLESQVVVKDVPGVHRIRGFDEKGYVTLEGRKGRIDPIHVTLASRAA